jgi:hypothetical protein
MRCVLHIQLLMAVVHGNRRDYTGLFARERSCTDTLAGDLFRSTWYLTLNLG